MDRARPTSPHPSFIGRFEVRGVLGQGAMATVYDCWDEAKGQAVAVKLLDRSLLSDTDAMARFEREIGALEKIRHPNVAQLLEADRVEDGRPFLVFERVGGPTLEHLIKSGAKSDPIVAIDWMIEASSALEEAWNHHIIHRDIKPSNIMIDDAGRLRIADFGLAKALFQDPNVTSEKALLGTPRYMSPEMGLSRSLDFRADMYSLGATFYHLLTRQSPFEAISAVEMLMKHANEPLTPARAIDPDLPEDLCTILTHLMAKDPAERYDSYSELIGDLRECRLALQSSVARARVVVPPEGDPGLLDPRVVAGGGRALSDDIRDADRPLSESDRRSRAAALRLVPPPSERKARGLVLVAVFILGLGIVAAFYANVFEARTGTGEQGGWLTRRLQSIDIFRPVTNPDREADRLEQSNLDRLKTVMTAVIKYEVGEGKLPGSTRQLVEQGYLESQFLVDAWGREFRYHGPTRTLRSNGPDGVRGTQDDYVMDESMRVNRDPQRLE